MKVKETYISEQEIDEVFERGILCEAQITVGEAVDCLLEFAKHISQTDMIKNFEKDQDIHKFLMCLIVSEVATLTENFMERDNVVGKA